MRISTAQMQDRAVTSMLDRQSDLSKTQQQLATGKRILKPSDDVLGTTQILALNKVIDTHKQFQDNSNVAETRLQQEESSLTNIADGLQRIHELSVQTSNPLYGASERANLAKEARQILSDVVSIANSTDSNGEYIFAGLNVDTPPISTTEVPPGSGMYTYAYTGDLGQRNIQIGDTRFIQVGDNGQDTFMNVPLSGGGTQSIFATLEQFAQDLESNTVNPTLPDDLNKAIDHMGGVLATIGARLNAIDSQRGMNTDIVLQGEKTLSGIQDLDYAEAVSRMNLQLTGLQASQQSFARIQNLSLFSFL